MKRWTFPAMLMVVGLLWLAGCAPAQAVQGQDEPRRWFKGNLHTHTLWSDGNEFPEVVTKWYHDRDYHFLVLSDHNILSEGIRWMKVSDVLRRGGPDTLDDYIKQFGAEWVELRGEGSEQQVRLKPLSELRALYEAPGRFLMIQGEEISDSVDKLPVHINAIHLQELIRPQGGRTVAEAIQKNLQAVDAQEQRIGRPILAQLNHPNFHWAVTAEDLAAVAEAEFFEVYNGHPQVNNEGDDLHASTERLWDIASTLRIAQMQTPPLYAVAVDDSHHFRGAGNSRPGRGWIMVRAAHLTPESILHAMRAGDFYATNGVELAKLEFDPTSRRLEIAVVPQAGARYTIEFIGTREGFNPTSRPVTRPATRPATGPATTAPAEEPLGRVTGLYSGEIGTMLKTVHGPSAVYEFEGDELYVRAVVRSSLPATTAPVEGVMQTAWTQPVGWAQPAAAPAAQP